MGDICSFLPLPSNVVIAKIALHYLDLLVEGQTFILLNLRNDKN